MKRHIEFYRLRLAVMACCAMAYFAMTTAVNAAQLNLDGYVDTEGAISIQYQGNTVDPYFTLQALLLAQSNGLDISAYAAPWANWLLTRQKPDATFDRFCRNGPVWAPCKTADADDALLALWLKFLDTMPAALARNKAWLNSYDKTLQALAKLLDPSRGVYLISPVYQHALFMDNLEVLTYQPPKNLRTQNYQTVIPDEKKLTRAIYAVFWDQATQRFLVSTQLEQKSVAQQFYPEAVAQIFPLLFDFKAMPRSRSEYYRAWMAEHRAEWLQQSTHDFSWGLIAVIAMKQRDQRSASCWLRETARAQHSAHWIITDEVARQVLLAHAIKPANPQVSCA